MKWTIPTIAALVLIPSLALAQQDTTRRDTSMRDTTSSAGQLAQPSMQRNFGLTSDQVKQLQDAINKNGCSAGRANGTIDRQTRRGIECIKRQKNVTSDNLNDVLRALNLSFTAPDSIMPMRGMRHDTSGMSHDTTMRHDTTTSRRHY